MYLAMLIYDIYIYKLVYKKEAPINDPKYK